MPKALRLLAVVPAIGLGVAGFLAMNIGLAGTVADDVTKRLRKTAAAELHPLLQAAIACDLRSPWVLELLGQTSEYPAQAAVHFREAIALRTTSPYTWANLAVTDYRLGETGSEFRTALVRAAELGPYEPEVQRTVADLGLAVWDEVDASMRMTIEGVIQRAMRFQPRETLQIAQRRGRLAIACRHAVGSTRQADTKWLQLCKSTEATS